MNWKNQHNLRTFIIYRLENIREYNLEIYNDYIINNFKFDEKYISKYKVFYETFIENWYKRYGLIKSKSRDFLAKGTKQTKNIL